MNFFNPVILITISWCTFITYIFIKALIANR